ncbi:MAG TPA: hypothetical protein VEL76_16575 [Gemmataceae bacterium]|nr:hypothetical protein [Gemmataceae bacterium]
MGKSRRPHFAPVRLNNQWVVEYAAVPSGVLRIEPAEVEAEIGFGFTHKTGRGDGDIFHLLFRIADSNGRLWEARIDPSPRLLVGRMIDLTRREPAHFEAHAPEGFRKAFAGRCVLEGANDRLDDRFHRCFVLDDMVFPLVFKHQGPTYDITVLEGDTLLVRASGLFGSWNRHHVPAPGEEPRLPVRPDPEEEEEDNEDPKSGGEGNYDNAPPIYFTLRLRTLLAAGQVYPHEEGSFGEADIPLPLRFSRLRSKRAPQPAVTFRPARSPIADPEPAALEGRFVPIQLGNDLYAPPREVAFPTTEAGDLVITASRLEGAFRLAVKQREPQRDVLSCALRVADADGDLWEAESLFTPEVFLEYLVDLERSTWAVLETEDEESRQAFQKPLLLTGVRDTLDDHGRRLFMVGKSALVVVTFDAQRPTYDVAEGLLVRVSGLSGRLYPADGDRDYVAIDVSKHTPDEQLLPPIVFPVHPRELIFRNTTFCVDEGFWHDNDLPIPLVFRRVPGNGTAQEDVVFRASPTTS